MSNISDRLNLHRKNAGIKIGWITQELAKLGIDRAESTVAGWFNGSRGSRWDMDELLAVLHVMGLEIDWLKDGEVELVEERIPAEIAREARNLTPEQQQAVLAIVRTMTTTKI